MESAINCLGLMTPTNSLWQGVAVVTKLFLIGIGGFLGSILRYVVSGYVQQLSKSIDFPYGTLAVNVIGCLIIGLLSYLADTRGVFSAEVRVFAFVGLLGGFTTFSTFGNETVNFLRRGESVFAFVNVAAHLLLGLMAVWLGRTTAYLLWR
jgi:CrcB protein